MMTDQKSKLGAIMFTDIVGYSGMMEEDEEKTVAVIKEHNRILFPLIEGHQGELIDAIGDGLLVVFDSALSSCKCALDIQKGIDQYNSEEGNAGCFYIRIGIHLGDIRIEDNRLYGTGINIAARIEPLALPGGICISEDIHKQLIGKIHTGVTDMGYKTLKNIKQKVKVLRLHTGSEQKGELSGIKQELIQAREELRSKTEKPDSFENKLESKITGFVENILDKAIVEWNDKPAGRDGNKHVHDNLRGLEGLKKLENLKELENLKHLDIKIGSGHGKGRHKKNKKDNNYIEELAAGIALTIGFGFVYIKFDIWWMLLLALFAGVIPTIKGISGFIKSRGDRKKLQSTNEKNYESKILSVLQELGGKTTVIQLASNLELSLDETQQYLDSFVKKGYLNQEIDPNGVLFYEIPKLL